MEKKVKKAAHCDYLSFIIIYHQLLRHSNDLLFAVLIGVLCGSCSHISHCVSYESSEELFG